MSYNKLGFTSGQTLKAEHLNHMEEGIFNASKGVSGGGASIIDVVELPTENIREDVFYRLLTGTFLSDRDVMTGWICHCVESLPEVGEPVTTDMANVTAYYNITDNNAYGYIPTLLGAQVGIPDGWHSIDELAPIFGINWRGIVHFLCDVPRDSIDEFYLLLTVDTFIYDVYQNEFVKMCVPYETPAVNIHWDGNVEGREIMSYRGIDGETSYFAKVSDKVLTKGGIERNSTYLYMSNGDGKPWDVSNEVGVIGSNLTLPVCGVSMYAAGSFVPWLISVNDSEAVSANEYFDGSISRGTYFCYSTELYLLGLYVAPKTANNNTILTSPNGTKFKLSVDNSGTISATEVTE